MKAVRQVKQSLSRWQRTAPVPLQRLVGVLLIIGGIFGFLPILGFWMIPLGAWILSRHWRWFRLQVARVRLWLRQRKRLGRG